MRELYVNGQFIKHITMDQLATELAAASSEINQIDSVLVLPMGQANAEVIKALSSNRGGQLK